MKIALIGYGKMGKTIETIAIERGHTIPLIIDLGNNGDLVPEKLKEVDVAIEFTGPGAAATNIKACLEAGIPVVSGSTGWLEQWDSISNLCKDKQGAMIYASNFSVGVNLFFELNKKLAALMQHQPSYEVSMEEIHHTEKKDAPSGTAITLAEQIMETLGTKKQWVNQVSTAPEDLSIISQRIDPAPGTHKIKYSSAIDDIEIIHTAHNRKGFATGAVLAAEFLQNRKGVFTMKEVLGI